MSKTMDARVIAPANHLAHIDGLRAVAILSVVAFHALPQHVTGGYVGVDVFFVISGFLITRLIVDGLENGTFSLVGFFARRIRRLLPAAVVVYVAAFAAGWFVLLPDAFKEFGASLGGAALLYANLAFYKLADYFEAPAHEKPLLHTWSLSIEEQFYLVWPLLLMLLVPRLPRRWLMAVTAAGLIASLLFAQRMLGLDQKYAFYMLQTRAWELMTGALLALSLPYVNLPRWVAETLAWLGAALITASVVLLNPGSPFPGLAALPACAGTAALLAACHRMPTSFGRILSFAPVVFVGLISYSLYLWHWPLLSLAHYVLERQPQGVEVAALVTAAFALAIVSWALIERPFRSGALRFADRQTLAGGVAAIAICALAGRLLTVGDGLPGRLDDAARTVFEQKVSQNPQRQRCENNENAFRDDAFCNIGRAKDPKTSYDAVIIGDSQADQFVPALGPLLQQAGLSARQITQNGCGPVIGLARSLETAETKYRACPEFHRVMLRFLDANPGLKLAVIATYWPNYERPLRLNGVLLPEGHLPVSSGGPPREIYEHHLRATIAAVERRGIRVLLIGALPAVRDELPLRCGVRARRDGTQGPACEMPSGPIVEQIAWSDGLLQRLAAEGRDRTVLLPTRLLCRSSGCATVLDGTFLYFDKTHLNAEGARRLGREFKLPALR